MSANSNTPYKVLALKYRPQNFDDLIGQEVLVRTISNAIKTNRIANAFLMTGIRGVGKTTTARIIARVLNCVGEDGKGGPTATPCGKCYNCVAIREDRHQDVLEMDAASRTGVDDIREIIENSKYLPTSARYKIYIIDEVHMLSKNAFNALLKTLEEPPAHVKFIFATTEIRKIPVTILSRCQRFDLRRIDNEILVPHLAKIAKIENAEIEEEALALIANASEGSVRDALSLLDQAISHSDTKITAEMTRDMLGLADGGKVIDIFEKIAEGEINSALAVFKSLYDASADPVLVLQDLLEFTYLVTKLKIMPDLNTTGTVPQKESERARAIAKKLDMSYLTRCWQMLLKGIGEVRVAANSFTATEMILIRLAYMAELPAPNAVSKEPIPQKTFTPAPAPTRAPSYSGSNVTTAHAPAYMPEQEMEEAPTALVTSFEQMVQLFKDNGEPLLYSFLQSDVKLIKFEQGRVELNISSMVTPDFAGRVSSSLKNWTGKNWVIVVSKSGGQPTLEEQKTAKQQEDRKNLEQHPDIQKILETFPGAYISKVE